MSVVVLWLRVGELLDAFECLGIELPFAQRWKTVAKQVKPPGSPEYEAMLEDLMGWMKTNKPYNVPSVLHEILFEVGGRLNYAAKGWFEDE